MTYERRPIPVKAVQWDGSAQALDEIQRLVPGAFMTQAGGLVVRLSRTPVNVFVTIGLWVVVDGPMVDIMPDDRFQREYISTSGR